MIEVSTISGDGHNEYAKRQATKAGIGFQALDNGFAAVDPAAVQAICDSLTEDTVEALLRKWLARLPHPYPRPTGPPATATRRRSCRWSSP
jgi:hypothetical protein